MVTVTSPGMVMVVSLEMVTVTSLETVTLTSQETVTVTNQATETPERVTETPSRETVTVTSVETLILEGAREGRQIMGEQGDRPTLPPLQTAPQGGGCRTKGEQDALLTILLLQQGETLKTLLTAIQPPITRMKVHGGIIFLEISTRRN